MPPGVSTRVTMREHPAAEGGTVGEKCPVNFCLNADLHVTFRWSFTCRKAATWDLGLYFPSEGKRAEDFFRPKKIRRLRPGANPRTWVPKVSTLPLDHRICLVWTYWRKEKSLDPARVLTPYHPACIQATTSTTLRRRQLMFPCIRIFTFPAPIECLCSIRSFQVWSLLQRRDNLTVNFHDLSLSLGVNGGMEP